MSTRRCPDGVDGSDLEVVGRAVGEAGDGGGGGCSGGDGGAESVAVVESIFVAGDR